MNKHVKEALDQRMAWLDFTINESVQHVEHLRKALAKGEAKLAELRDIRGDIADALEEAPVNEKETLTLADLEEGGWLDVTGDLLTLHGEEVRRTYSLNSRVQTDDSWWIDRALNDYGPYTRVTE